MHIYKYVKSPIYASIQMTFNRILHMIYIKHMNVHTLDDTKREKQK